MPQSTQRMVCRRTLLGARQPNNERQLNNNLHHNEQSFNLRYKTSRQRLPRVEYTNTDLPSLFARAFALTLNSLQSSFSSFFRAIPYHFAW